MSVGEHIRWALVGLALAVGPAESSTRSTSPPEFLPSRRSLTLAVEIDRESARLIAYTVKNVPFAGAADLPPPRAYEDGSRLQLEIVLLGPGDRRHVQRVDTHRFCFSHPPELPPHIGGDIAVPHRDSLLIRVPEIAGFDRFELAYHDRNRGTATRRSLGIHSIDASSFTRAAGTADYSTLAIAKPAEPPPRRGGAAPAGNTALWPEDFDDLDIYAVHGNEAEIGERINIVIVPDGYTYAEKSVMESHAQAMVDTLRASSPFGEHDNFVNYFLVYAYSLQSGTDECDCGIVVDTAMGTRFPQEVPGCGADENRCINYFEECDAAGTPNIVEAELRAPALDATIIMVNSSRGGGCTLTRAVYTADHAPGATVARHELGHLIAQLSDEYEGNPGCGGIASGINTSTDGVTGDWPEWIGDLGPPREGAEYWSQCIFRPENACAMRASQQPFCHVCNQQWSLSFFGHPRVAPTAPLTSMSPGSEQVVAFDTPVEFSVDTRFAAGPGVTNEVTWTIEGPGYTEPTVVATGVESYTHAFASAGIFTLTCDVVADANLVKPAKNGANAATATWEVCTGPSVPDCNANGLADTCEPECNGNSIPDECDIAGGTSSDCDGNEIPDECDTVVTFSPSDVATDVNGARSAFAVDLDGDGDLDIVTAARHENKIYWYENLDGAGQYGPERVVGDPAWQVRDAIGADIDGDGDNDVVSTEFQVIAWYENDPSINAFSPKHQIDAASWVWDTVVAEDLDDDGDLDVLAGSIAGEALRWYENDGFGGFQLIQAFPVSGGCSTVAAADFDGDGDVDVVSPCTLEWFRNFDGEGNYLPGGPIDDECWDAVVATDLDGDGYIDVVAGREDRIAWARNSDGLGAFGPLQTVSADILDVGKIFSADLDADGDTDIVSASPGDDTIAWYENIDGAGSFSDARIVSTSEAGTRSVHVGDLDGDGDLDLVAAAEMGDSVVWFENGGDDCDGNSVPDECEADCNQNGINDTCDIVNGTGGDCNGNSVPDVCDIGLGTSADCDSDAVPDECQADCNGNEIADSCDIDAGTSFDCGPSGNGIPDECEPDCDGNGEADSCDLATGAADDCNADGIPDLCETDCNDDGMPDGCEVDCNENAIPDICETQSDCDADEAVDLCQTNVSFTVSSISTVAIGARSVRAADLDGDGDSDILSASMGENTIGWHENADGLGSFSPRKVISTNAASAQSVFAADLDGDGDIDALSASLADDTIAWYENLDGSGSFGAERIISTAADGPRSVVAADVDGDGDPDVLSASTNDDRIAWYQNADGLGNFGPQRTITTTADVANSLTVADVDGDGDLDAVSTAAIGGVAWYENTNGLGLFGPPQLAWSGADVPTSVVAADVNGDRDLDLVVALAGNNWIALLENTDGAGSFAAPIFVVTDVGAYVRWVAAADLDGDGDVDLLSAAGNEIAWNENLDGSESFGPRQVVNGQALSAQAVIAADLDSDGDTDVISASSNANEIAWYPNGSGDCDGNGIPDACEVDCNVNGITDACDLRAGTSVDCDDNGAPDECDTGCVDACDTDGDGCVDATDADPLSSFVCGDSDADGCDDCAGGSFDPLGDGSDADSDGACDARDCQIDDNTIWLEPEAVTTLVLFRSDETVTLTWQRPERPGATSVRYDVLRSPAPFDFSGSGTCLVIDSAETHGVDLEVSSSGSLHGYLVRVENDCPGGVGTLGPDSTGTPRHGLSCP